MSILNLRTLAVRLQVTVELSAVRDFEALIFLVCTEPIRLFIFSISRQSSKTNWRCYNKELRLKYPQKPVLH